MNPTVQIRKAALADMEAIREIYNEAILTTTATFDTEPKSTDERLQWFLSHDERLRLGEAQLRRLCSERGLDWDRLSEEEREEFSNRLLHEE